MGSFCIINKNVFISFSEMVLNRIGLQGIHIKHVLIISKLTPYGNTLELFYAWKSGMILRWKIPGPGAHSSSDGKYNVTPPHQCSKCTEMGRTWEMGISTSESHPILIVCLRVNHVLCYSSLIYGPSAFPSLTVSNYSRWSLKSTTNRICSKNYVYCINFIYGS